MKIYLFCILLVIQITIIHSQEILYYDHHPMSKLSLGIGFDPQKFEPKEKCIEFDERKLDYGAGGTKFKIMVISTEEHLLKTLGIDVRLEARSFMFEGKANFSLSNSNKNNNNTINAVIYAYSEYPRIGMSNAKLNQDARELITSGKMDEFEKRFGSQYVSIIRRGAWVAAIVSFQVSDQTSLNTINADLKLAGGWGPLSGKAETTFKTELNKASERQEISVSVESNGGEGLGPLEGMVKAAFSSKNAIEKIKIALANYLSKFNESNSAILGYHIASMTNFGWSPINVNYWDQIKEEKLYDLISSYKNALYNLEQTKEKILSLPQNCFSETTNQRISRTIDDYEEYLKNFGYKIKQCVNDTLDIYTIKMDKSRLDKISTTTDESLRIVEDGAMWNAAESIDYFQNSTDSLRNPIDYIQLRKDKRPNEVKLVIKIDGFLIDYIDFYAVGRSSPIYNTPNSFQNFPFLQIDHQDNESMLIEIASWRDGIQNNTVQDIFKERINTLKSRNELYANEGTAIIEIRYWTCSNSLLPYARMPFGKIHWKYSSTHENQEKLSLRFEPDMNFFSHLYTTF